MRSLIRICYFVMIFGAFTRAQAESWQPSPGHRQISIWSGKIPDAPSYTGTEGAQAAGELVAGRPWVYVGNVSKPTMTVYSAKGRNSGVAIVVFPGGGYQILAIDLEGTEACDWLTSKGITCVLLKYRVPGVPSAKFPKSGAYPGSPMALEDAQRTLRLVRFHASEWHIDPHKIGVLGFSAGGHLVAALSTNFEKRLYGAADKADKESCRPDFAIALYPGHMLEHTSKDHQLNPYIPVSATTPPTFLVQAEDDPMDDVENSRVYFAALKKANVPVEMHIYPLGGHAFGLRRTKFPITAWPELVEKWLKNSGII